MFESIADKLLSVCLLLQLPLDGLREFHEFGQLPLHFYSLSALRAKLLLKVLQLKSRVSGARLGDLRDGITGGN